MTNLTYSAVTLRYFCMALFALHSMPVISATLHARVTDAAGQALADAVVYAEPVTGMTAGRSGRAVAIEQKDREFTPYVSVIQAGTSVIFPNRDAMRHHVYSFSPAKPFEIKLYSGDITREILFDKPGVVTLGCNIHDWMVGYVFVAETPYFAKTDKNGDARLSDLPAGEYDVKVWHPTQRNATAKKAQKLEANANIETAFSIDAAPRKKKFKPPLDPLSY
jgi:plastocyanin